MYEIYLKLWIKDETFWIIINRNNEIGVDGCKALSESIKKLEELTELNLDVAYIDLILLIIL